MKSIAAVALATTLFASGAIADVAAPLPVGKPAGVHKAQMEDSGLLLFFGAAVVAGGVALVVSSGNSNGNIIATTTSTAP